MVVSIDRALALAEQTPLSRETAIDRKTHTQHTHNTHTHTYTHACMHAHGTAAVHVETSRRTCVEDYTPARFYLQASSLCVY